MHDLSLSEIPSFIAKLRYTELIIIIMQQLIRQSKKGGKRATLFIFVMAALETMAFISNGVSLVTYFNGQMNLSLTKSANALTNFMGTSFLLPLLGGFISDTYLSRFKTCLLFGTFEVLGFVVLALQAHFKELRPPPCKPNAAAAGACESPTGNQEAVLFTGLYLVALGTSGIKAALPSLGADQFDEKDTKQAASLSSFFNWFMFALTIGAILGVTFVVWISTNQGWDWAFGACAAAVATGLTFLAAGTAFYRHNVPKGSPLVRILQVFVVAFRNRNIELRDDREVHQVHDKEAPNQEILLKTDQFRCLDRAAIITPQNASSSADHLQATWKLCSETQVEETKILVRMLPIILSTVFMNTCLAQLQTFSIQQSLTMDRNIGDFQMPAPSIPLIPLLFQFILLPLYDRAFVPFARRLTGIPTGITHLQRIGAGLVLATISMVVSGVMETRRKNVAIERRLVDSTHPLPISIFWLAIQYAIFGAGDMLTLVGMLEFFYAESSLGMKSLGTAISWCSLAFGYFTSSVVVEVVNGVSGGWLASNNLNRDRLEYFYWLLAGVSAVNFAVYLLCAHWYRYKKTAVEEDGNGRVDSCNYELADFEVNDVKNS